MDLIVGRGGELEAAAVARVRLLLAMVHAAVGHQLTLLSKTLVAVVAAEGLLACGKTRTTSLCDVNMTSHDLGRAFKTFGCRTRPASDPRTPFL